MSRLVVRLIVSLVLATGATAAVAAEKPSFDCATAKTAREKVVCRDARLAASDRAMAAAYGDARRLLPSDLRAPLAKDQAEFLRMLEAGFDAEIWFKANVPEDPKKVEADIRRTLAEGRDTIDALRAEIDDRTAMLRSIRGDVSDVVGRWKNARATLTVGPRLRGTHAVRYEAPSYGWPKYACSFEGTGRLEGDRLIVEFAPEEGSEALPRGRLVATRTGPLLDILETVDEGKTGDERQYWICARSPEVKGRFLAVGAEPR
jgi:hypothetical protein